MNPFFFLTTMYHMAWSLDDEEDDAFTPRLEIRKLHSEIPKFPDNAPFGPKATGALKALNDWIQDDVGEFLESHEKSEFLDDDHGIPVDASIKDYVYIHDTGVKCKLGKFKGVYVLKTVDVSQVAAAHKVETKRVIEPKLHVDTDLWYYFGRKSPPA